VKFQLDVRRHPTTVAEHLAAMQFFSCFFSP